MWVAHLRPLGNWGHLLGPDSFGDPLHLGMGPRVSEVEFSIVRVGGQPYLPHQTPPLSCIFRGVPLTHSFLVVPTCPVPLLGRDLLARLGASISFAPLICLNPSSQTAPLLLLLASQPTNTTMLFPLPASQVDPRVWDVQTPLLLNTILLLSSNYWTLPGTSPKLNTLSCSRASGDLSLSFLIS